MTTFALRGALSIGVLAALALLGTSKAEAAIVGTLESSGGGIIAPFSSDDFAVFSFNIGANDATISKSIDASSVILAQAALLGIQLDWLTLTLFDDTFPPPQALTVYVFTDVLISSFTPTGRDTEEIGINYESVSLRTVPEPSTYSMLLLGAVPIAYRAVRRRVSQR